MFQNWPLCIPGAIVVTFPAGCCVLNILLTGDVGYFLSILWRLLSGASWLIQYPFPVTRSLKKSHQHCCDICPVSVCKQLRLCILGSCFGTNFHRHIKPNLVLDDSVSRTTAHAKSMHHFIDSHMFVTHNHGTDSFDAVDVEGRPDYSSSVTIVQPFLNVTAQLYTPRCDKALHSYCAESLQWISWSLCFYLRAK